MKYLTLVAEARELRDSSTVKKERDALTNILAYVILISNPKEDAELWRLSLSRYLKLCLAENILPEFCNKWETI